MTAPTITDEEKKMQKELAVEFSEYRLAMKEYKYLRAAGCLAAAADIIANFARDKPEFNQ